PKNDRFVEPSRQERNRTAEFALAGSKATQVPIAPNDTTMASDSRRTVARTQIGAVEGGSPPGVALAQV
ncbi:MAG: hypothetical protein WAK08_15425, partial [Pseudolabrys sp.]